VARHPRGTIVFLEVKSAFAARSGDPAERMTATKQRRVCKAATAWLVAHDRLDSEARFDLVLVHPDGRLEHLEDAFPYLD
jgi:putative endonuclease